MDAAVYGHLSIVLVLLQHSANPDLQDIDGVTALMRPLTRRARVLRRKRCCDGQGQHRAARPRRPHRPAGAEIKGHTAIAKLLRQHAAPPQPAAAAPAAPPDAGEPAVSAPASLPLEILESAQRGELRRWSSGCAGGLVDALCSCQS